MPEASVVDKLVELHSYLLSVTTVLFLIFTSDLETKKWEMHVSCLTS